jgi:glyoxylase-like metal-dependent hydrolase (beta-lactamase superfamily II)
MPIQHITVGEIDIVSLTDTEGSFFTYSAAYPTTPRETWEPFRSRYPDCFAGEDGLVTRVGCFLVRTGNRTLLVDTGIGPGPVALFGESRGRLLEELASCGVAPRDVDLVFLTHLHPDHVGWNLTPKGEPTFPNARYVISQVDWEVFHRPEVKAAMEALVPSYLDRDVTPLAALAVLELIEGETEIAPGVRAFPTPGHTAGHMSLQVTSGDQQALVLGDVFHHPAQAQVPEICIAFDMDTGQAVQTRRRIVEWAVAEGMVLAGCHLLPQGLGRIKRQNGLLSWEPL